MIMNNISIELGDMNATFAKAETTYDEIKKYAAKHDDEMKVLNLNILIDKEKMWH